MYLSNIKVIGQSTAEIQLLPVLEQRCLKLQLQLCQRYKGIPEFKSRSHDPSFSPI